MKYYFERTVSILAAIIFLQTLFYKFSAAPESVFIFSELGVEPYGRIGSGVIELVVSVLLLFRKTSLLGAVAGIAVISGAIGAHLFILGIEVQDDGGKLFLLALVVFILCLISILLQKNKLLELIKSFSNRTKLSQS